MQRLLCALLIFANALSPLAYAESDAAMESTPTPAAKQVSAEPCEVVVRGDVEYQKIGYVTASIVKQLTSTTPLLFTPLYFRALAKALGKNGFTTIANANGVYREKIAKDHQKAVIDVMTGDSDKSQEMQAKVAVAMWNSMVADLQINKDIDPRNEQLEMRKAYYDSIEDFRGVRQYLKTNLSHKNEAIELIRLSLPFGIQMAADSLGRSFPKAIVLTTVATVGTGLLTYVATKLLALMGSPSGAGFLPYLIPAVSTTLAGASTYFFTVPKSHIQKAQIWMMNFFNRRSLYKQGLISKEDGESTLLIKSAFKDLGQLRDQVSVAKIQMVPPIPPASTEIKDVESSMLRYADQLAQYMNVNSALQEMVATKVQKQSRQMGEPINTLARLLQLKGEGTAYGIPNNARVAIQEYADEIVKGYELMREAEVNYEALLVQYDLHIQVLKAFTDGNDSILDTRSKVLLEQKLKDMEAAKLSIQTLINVVVQQKTTMETDKRALDSALKTIAIAAGNNALNKDQATSLTNDLLKLKKTIDAAEASDLKDNEKLPTGSAK